MLNKYEITENKQGIDMIITIDGPAAAGKGTISTILAEQHKLARFDTGMVYRAVGLLMILNNISLENESKAEEFAKNLTFPQMMELSTHPDFRSDTGGKAASVVSSYPTVRKALLKMQQDFALNPVFANGQKANGVVYDGRDTGTVVCPNADLKIFVTADIEIRAMRRYKEFIAKGINAEYKKVLQDMIERDERDKNRSSAPLKPAEGAFILDNSHIEMDNQIKIINNLIAELQNKN